MDNTQTETITETTLDIIPSTEIEVLQALYNKNVEQAVTLTQIKTELTATKTELNNLQLQLVGTYELIACMFMLLIFYGLGKLFSSLFNHI